MMIMYHHGPGMMLGMVVFWALVLGGGMWLLARLFPVSTGSSVAKPEQPAGRADPALQVLRQRYASGEITKAEYEEVLRTLG